MRYSRSMQIRTGDVKIVSIHNANTNNFIAYKVYRGNHVAFTTTDYNEAECHHDWLLHQYWNPEDTITEEQFKAEWKPRVPRIL